MSIVLTKESPIVDAEDSLRESNTSLHNRNGRMWPALKRLNTGFVGAILRDQEAERKARADLIDRQIKEDSKRLKRECKILLLGACLSSALCPSEGNGVGKILCLRERSQSISFLHDRCQ